MDAKIARIFTCYGPRMLKQSGRYIPDMIYAALNNRDIIIAGDESTGTSLCYVKDMVEGIVALMHSSIKQPINLGNDGYFLMKDVADKVLAIAGSSSKITYDAGLPYTHQQAVPDITLAKEKLHWLPLVNIDDGLTQTISHARANYKDTLDIRRYGRRKAE